MKVTSAVIFTLTLVAVAHGLPAKKEEVEVVPLEKNPYGDQPIVDTGIIGWGSPFSNPFNGLFENLEGIMTRMHNQMNNLLKRFPIHRSNDTSAEIPDFDGLPAFPKFTDLDLGKGNTTSVTKVIDGHKVVINETEYKKEDDFGGTFFKVRIIDVKPDSSELTTEREAEEVTVTPQIVKDREAIENSIENEIAKSREVNNFENIETFDEVDASTPFQKTTEDLAHRNTEWDDVKPVETFEGNSINSYEAIQPIDLSNDIYVNQLMAESGAPTNPDAEVFFVPQNPGSTKQSEKLINPR